MLWLIVRSLWLYLHFVGKTSKIVCIDKEHEEKLRAAGTPAIYVCWHGRQAILIYAHRGRRISPLASPSKDGEIAARLASLFGMTPVRGSSRKKPDAALRSLMEQVRKGYCIGLTPDGPVGPEREVKSGVIYLAQKLGIPILPISASFKRKTILKSWDTFLFPFPFNKVVIAYGEPIRIAEGDDLDQKSKDLKKVLDNLTDKADDLANSI